jgi:hypothetical protein
MTWSRTARPGWPGASALRERLPELVAAARRHRRQQASPGDAALLGGAGLAPLAGGRNNDVYACTLLGVRVCLKFHLTDGRRRAEREWRALGALAARGYADAPRPLHYEPEPDPVVAMTLVPGSGLGQARLDQAQLDALAGSVRTLNAVTGPGDPRCAIQAERVRALLGGCRAPG